MAQTNKFWAAPDSSDEAERDSESEASVEQPQTFRAAGGKFGKATYEESDSDSDDEVRVVKSQKDRAWDGIKDAISRIRNARKNSDWPQIQDEFETANRLIEKSKMLIMRDGLPKFYIKMLAEVEDHVQIAVKDKETVKKMKPVVSRALNQMKLKVKKHNENYRTEILDYRENPSKYEEEEEEADSEEDDDDDDDSDSDDSDSAESSDADGSESEEDITKKPTVKKTTAKDDGSESEDSLFADDDSSSDSDDDGRQELKGRAKWLKKLPDSTAAKDVKKDVKKVQKVSKKKEYLDVPSSKKSTWALDEQMTAEALDKRVAELVASRGKKNTDTREVLRQMELLTKIARLHGPRKEIPVQMHLVSAMYDAHRSIDDYMGLQQWRTCFRSLMRIMTLLEENEKLVLGTLQTDELAGDGLGKAVPVNPEEDISEEKSNSVRVTGSMESFIIRLEEEYTKSLQQINPHTQEYVIRLSDEASLMILAESITNYYVRVGNFRAASAVALMNVEHLYYKHDKVAEAVHKSYLFTKKYGKYGDLHPACSGKALLPFGSTAVQHPGSFMGNPAVVSENFNPRKRLNDLCSFIYNHGDERSKTRALLCSVFHHAIHDRYHVARDLFLISHIQDFIEKADVRTQILFNRTLVVLGLCAFRLGFFQKAFESLSGICSGRARELLAQGQMKWADKDPEQEKLERRRQMPYHMHINPDLMECCHLTCAMLLELPNLARNGGSLQNTPIISKQFRKFLHAYNRSMFAGPPENTRDHVMAATKAVLDGNWKKACDYILNLEVWNLIPNDGGEKVKEMLRVRIQEEAVRTYLLINGAHYDTIGLDHICSLFDMEKSVVRRIISKMIFLRELSAAWDPNDILVMYHTDVSQLQTLSQGLVEKLSALIESNERLLDPLAGVYGYKDDWNTRDKKSQWQENSNANRRPGPRAQGFKPNPGGRGGRGGGRGSGGRSGRGWNGKKSGQTSKYSESQGNNKRAWNTPNANPASN